MQQLIYIRLFRATKICAKTEIRLQDIAHIFAPKEIQAHVEQLVALKMQQKSKGHYVITMMEIIAQVTQNFPDYEVRSVGEMDGVIDYDPSYSTPNKVFEKLKALSVMAIVFSGGMIAIMTYQTDVSLRETFSVLYEVLTGEVSDNPLWIVIPYAIGIPVGITLFFNHFSNKRFTDDPTPIQMEIDLYDNQADDTIINTLLDEKRGSGP